MKTCIRDYCGMPFDPTVPEKRDLTTLRAFWWRYCPKHRESPEPQTIVERVDEILSNKQSCECKTLYAHQQFDACITANGMEPQRFKGCDSTGETK